MRLNKRQKEFVQRLALNEPEELDRQEQRVLFYYRCARNIHKKADKQARQIWRRVTSRGEELRP